MTNPKSAAAGCFPALFADIDDIATLEDGWDSWDDCVGTSACLARTRFCKVLSTTDVYIDDDGCENSCWDCVAWYASNKLKVGSITSSKSSEPKSMSSSFISFCCVVGTNLAWSVVLTMQYLAVGPGSKLEGAIVGETHAHPWEIHCNPPNPIGVFLFASGTEPTVSMNIGIIHREIICYLLWIAFVFRSIQQTNTNQHVEKKYSKEEKK